MAFIWKILTEIKTKQSKTRTNPNFSNILPVTGKTCKNLGKHLMTKFHLGKTWENTRKTQENARKHAKTREIIG